MNEPRDEGTDAHILQDDQVRSVLAGLAPEIIAMCGVVIVNGCDDPFESPLCPECKSAAGWLTDRRHEFGVINIETGVITGAQDGSAA